MGTHLYGRRMYEVMRAWEQVGSTSSGEQDEQDPAMLDFAQLWRAVEKVVYSTTLETVDTARTTIERAFEPERVLGLKADSEADLVAGGPRLAAHAFAAGPAAGAPVR